MKIRMIRSELGAEDGVTVRLYGPGEIDIAESLAVVFIEMGIAEVIHENEMEEPKPSEMSIEDLIGSRKKKKRRG